jgi:hypothetical protein
MLIHAVVHNRGVLRFILGALLLVAAERVVLAQDTVAADVLAFRGSALHSDVPGGNQIPFYLLPSIGGHNTLRDFLSYRFHDNNTLVVNAESRFGLYPHLDLAVFCDAGNVAAAFDDLNLAP